MGQANLKRTEFEAREAVSSPAVDDIQQLAFTGYFNVGDTVDVIEVDAFGDEVALIADNLSILAIDNNASLTLSAVVDTNPTVGGTVMIRAQEIDDGQEAIDRLYRRKASGDIAFVEREDILAQALNTPSAGKTTFYVEDVSFYRVGDIVDILADEGIVAIGAVIESVSPNADDVNNRASVVITTLVDTSTFTNPFINATSITMQQAIERNQERIDEIDKPVENEDMAAAGEDKTAFDTVNTFKAGSTKLLLDGIRKRLGTAGTRASLSQGAGDAQLLFTAMVLGLKGNLTQVRVVNAAGLTVTVTGSFNAGFSISINSNSGTATAAQIAAALNADPVAKRLILVRYGGTGASAVVPFAYVALAGGLDNGSGDYAELEQVYLNQIVNTGYKWISFWILPNDANRMNKPPKSNEELVIDYRRPSENVNR